MKQFLVFVRKEFYHILRDKRTILILLCMPVIQIMLFGFAVTTEVKNSNIAVFDPSNDVATRRIVDQLNASSYFKVVKFLHTNNEIHQVLLNRQASLVVVFSEKFYENLMHTGKAQLQIIADATDPNMATISGNYAGSIIASYQQALMAQNKTPYRITPELKLLYNPQMKGAYNFVPGVLGLIFILICAMMTSIAIVREKEMGTMEVLLASPMRPIFVILSKMVPYFVLSCVNLTTVLLLSIFVLKVPVSGSLGSLIFVSLLYIVVALSLGLLVSTIAETQVVASLISGMILMVPIMLLSGMIFPVENMPVILQWLSHIIPAKWYIMAVRTIMIKGLGLRYVIPEVSVLSGMALVLIVVSLKKFKVRL